MLQIIRSILFDIAFYTTALLLLVVFCPALLLPYPYFLWFDQIWCHSILFLSRFFAGIRYRVEGYHNIPEQNYIVASLHQSAWDVFGLTALFPHPIFVCKKELFSLPFLGWYLQRFKMIPVNRKQGAMALKNLIHNAHRIHELHRPIIIFPEGTRSPMGHINSFQMGIAMLYESLNVPVVPVVLNSGYLWKRKGLIKKSGIIDVKILPPIQPGLSRQEFIFLLQKNMKKSAQKIMSSKEKNECA